ncbi:PE domain-containing protein [Actinosynnema sp. NPDC023587]|uniref:PE domain-containing protein n=1 Tax=Actinosynnema sp. NPDC023587 TaxID=3154695 RepID=UPI0033F122EE
MPFLTGGGGGAGAPAAAPVTMQVAPEQILALKARYEEVRNQVHGFLAREEWSLIGQAAVADDEVSKDAAGTFVANATSAVDVTRQFLVELNRNIDQLDSAARTYQLVEDVNTDAMLRQNRGL